MVLNKTTVLTIDRGAPRGFYVFWTTDGGVTWLTSKKRALRSERELTKYLKFLSEKWQDAKFERVQNVAGTIPDSYWKDGKAGSILTVVDGAAFRGMKSDPTEPKERPEPAAFADLGPPFQWKHGEVEGIEVRRNFNFRSLSIRIEGDRPTVKTLQEWQRFIKHLAPIQHAVEKFESFVSESKELKARAVAALEEVEAQFLQDNRQKILSEVEKRLLRKADARPTRVKRTRTIKTKA